MIILLIYTCYMVVFYTVLKCMCIVFQNRIYLGMTTLKELIIKRPCMKLEFLDVLLDFTSHERSEVGIQILSNELLKIGVLQFVMFAM